MKLTNIKILRHLVIFTLLLLNTAGLFSQTQNVRERVFIDVNAHDLLVGETLQYSATLLSHTTNKTSPLSKYLYVELIGESGVVFQRKHQLNNGKASGEFFLPSAMETGQYYLVAYTRWMRNFGDMAKSPLVFINPYKGHLNIKEDNPKLSVEFATISGEIVAGARNYMSFKVMKGNKPVERKGRVIGDDGKIADISSNAYGIGSFEISPQQGKEYQLLIENPDGGIEFFDLPATTSNATGLNISHTNDFIGLEPIGNVQLGQLLIEHQGKVVYEKAVENTSILRIARNELPKEILKVTFKDGRGVERFTAPLFNTGIVEKTSQQVFATRTTASLDQELPKGNYSLSIRKSYSSQQAQKHALYSKVGFDLPKNLSLSELQQAAVFYAMDNKEIPETVTLLPEYRYEILEGTLKAENDSSDIAFKDVVLSLTGEGKLNMSVARTNRNGKFQLEYQTVHRGEMTPAHLTLPDFKNAYSFEVSSNFIQNHQLSFDQVVIDTTQLEDIKERSIISQLENAYFTPSLDSSEIENNVPPTIPYFNASYDFDDYTRFRTLKEHFVEYIQVAGVRERRGEKRFILYSFDAGFSFETEPMVFLDGVPVPGNEILEFSPYRIQSVDVFNRRYFLGTLVADGVLSFQTIEGNLGGFTFDKNHMTFELLTPQPAAEETTNLTQKSERVPDSRIQLLWLPEFEVETEGLQQIQFNTSDIEGDFEMVIEGFTEDGTPVSIINKFKVKELNNE